MKIGILTGSELRHDFVRLVIAADPQITVALSVCEGLERSLLNMTLASIDDQDDLRLSHVRGRYSSERDFFESYASYAEDRSRPIFVPKGAVNDSEIVDRIRAAAPDLLVCYGSSLIKGSLLDRYAGRFLNVHLGLSPWYRGSGTNFWALVNGEPEFFGATFMYIDGGVDTGEIIHQVRPIMYCDDTPHQIGNRLISQIPGHYRDLIKSFDCLERVEQPTKTPSDRVYRRKNFSTEAVQRLYRNFGEGMIGRYLADKAARDRRARIVVNPVLCERRGG